MFEQLPLPTYAAFRAPMPGPHRFEALLRAVRYLPRLCKIFTDFLTSLFVRIATLPYYRLYHFNTIDPLERIAVLASESPQNKRKLLYAVSSWRARKLSELQFITISCTVLAAAVIGAFSWTMIEDAYWLTYGFWHSSLILAILGILLSASEVTVLHLLGPLSPVSKLSRNDNLIERYRPLLLSRKDEGARLYVPRKKMVFTWQGPLMFMSYSVCSFLAGLTIHVCTPFIREGRKWTAGHNIATMYLTVFVGGLTAFIFCSYWVYHYVDLGLDTDGEEQEQEYDERDSDDRNATGYSNTLMPFPEGRPSRTADYRQTFALPERSNTIKQAPRIVS